MTQDEKQRPERSDVNSDTGLSDESALAEKSRKAVDFRGTIRDFEAVAADLARQIQAEEERTGVHDQKHFSYSAFAKAAALRRDKLLATVAELKAQLEGSPSRSIDVDDPRLRPAQRAALIRHGSGLPVVLTPGEEELAWQHLKRLGSEFEIEHAGEVVSIEPSTGRYSLGRTAIDAVYSFEQAYGPARLMNFTLGPARMWGL